MIMRCTADSIVVKQAFHPPLFDNKGGDAFVELSVYGGLRCLQPFTPTTSLGGWCL